MNQEIGAIQGCFFHVTSLSVKLKTQLHFISQLIRLIEGPAALKICPKIYLI